MRVVVDADYLVYSSGFATEKNKYDVSVLRPDGTEDSVILDSKDEVNAWLSDEPKGTEIFTQKLIEPEPLSHALHIVNQTLEGIRNRLHKRGPGNELELFITGKGNFRDALATIKGYKANRDPAHKPFYYDQIRKYLQTRWGATEVTGYEADDAVAMEAHKESYSPQRIVIASVDKDMLTIPGSHYNWKHKKLIIVNDQEALVNFYRQLITGDATDNIGGAYKSGKLAADMITEENTEQGIYDYVLRLYKKGLGVTGCPYGNMGAEDALLENARLLHLKRFPDDVWEPPHRRGK